jgi:hypothetical protein
MDNGYIPARTSVPLKYVGYLHMSLHTVILLKKGNIYVRDTYTTMICATEHYSIRQNYVVVCFSRARGSRLVYISLIFLVTTDLRVASQRKIQNYET